MGARSGARQRSGAPSTGERFTVDMVPRRLVDEFRAAQPSVRAGSA
jgi:hypothetical protein